MNEHPLSLVTIIKDDTLYPATYRAICSHTGAVGKGASPSAAVEDLGQEIRRLPCRPVRFEFGPDLGDFGWTPIKVGEEFRHSSGWTTRVVAVEGEIVRYTAHPKGELDTDVLTIRAFRKAFTKVVAP